MHRRLTLLIGLMAVLNLALSVALVRPFGIVGVAIGTAVPVTLVAVGGLVPHCLPARRTCVQRVFREALWPALWPAAISLSILAFTGVATAAHVAIGRASVGVQHCDLFCVFPARCRTGRPA